MRDAPDAYEAALRVPPGNADLEIAVLGAILVNNGVHDQVADFLRPEHFIEPAHQRIYAAASTLIQRGQAAKPATLRTFLEREKSLEEIGGTHYLAELASNSLEQISAPQYARHLFDLWQRRKLIDLLRDANERAFAGDIDDPPSKLIEDIETSLYALTEQRREAGRPRHVREFMDEALRKAQDARNQGVSGISTGLKAFDALVGGWSAPDFIILGGRPGMGKSLLAFRFAFNAASAGKRVLGFSLEMAGDQLATRELAADTGHDSNDIGLGKVATELWPALVGAGGRISDLPFYIEDTPSLTPMQIRARARRHKRRLGLDLIVIDYLQLVRWPKAENRVQEITEISRAFKELAKELDVPVLCLSQLSRQVEGRDDKRPQLADLRDSGSIEQDSDTVFFAYRPEYYMRMPAKRRGETPEKHIQVLAEYFTELVRVKGTCELIVAKQRHGPTDTVTVRMDLKTCRVEDIDPYAGAQEEAPF